MNSPWNSLGVVHLRDLNDRNRWDTRKLSAYLDRLGLAERSGKAPPGQLSISAVAPPTRLIALNRADDVELLRKFRGWLGQAEELHLVVCYTGHPDEHDREQSEREASSALFPTLVAKIYHWGNHQEAPFGLSLILDTAKLAWPAPPALARDGRNRNTHHWKRGREREWVKSHLAQIISCF